MTVNICTAQEKLRQRRNEALVWIISLITVFGSLLIVSVQQRHAVASELDRRPAIGYPVYRGEYTIFIMNMELAEVYWFTDCPRMTDFSRDQEVAIYGDHLNRCRDWRSLTTPRHEVSGK